MADGRRRARSIDGATGRLAERVAAQEVSRLIIRCLMPSPPLALTAAACNCGGVSVTISPTEVNLSSLRKQQFTATVTGASDKSVKWSVDEGDRGGSIDETGLYSPPAITDTFHVTATSVADPNKSARATISVRVRSRIFSLPESCLLYPAHDYRGLTATSVAEEKKFNPRLGGEVCEGDYVGYMKNLDLPHPKKIDEAVPANLRGGQPGNETAAPPDPHWAPLRFTFGGVWEVEPHWLEENLAKVQVLDVREPDEWSEEHIPEAIHLSRGTLELEIEEKVPDVNTTVILHCGGGGRSALAAESLQKMGYKNVRSLAGGFKAWKTAGLPTTK